MADYSEHMRLLVLFFLGLAFLYILTYTLRLDRLWNSTLTTILILVAVVLILARFGGDLGRTI